MKILYFLMYVNSSKPLFFFLYFCCLRSSNMLFFSNLITINRNLTIKCTNRTLRVYLLFVFDQFILYCRITVKNVDTGSKIVKFNQEWTMYKVTFRTLLEILKVYIIILRVYKLFLYYIRKTHIVWYTSVRCVYT